MTSSKKSMFDRVLAVMLSVLMVAALLPVSMIGVAVEETSTYATVSIFTSGTITNNGTANVEVLVENTTLAWVEGNALRAEGWWVGIDVVAPTDFSADATYKVKTNPTAEYGDAKSFAEMKDGENDIQLWFPVSAESLEKFASENRNLTLVYAFDWDANEEYEQTIVFSVVPSEKIVLTKNGEQVYPKIVNYGTVSTYTGGTIKDNGTANVEVLVEETTLQWVAANALRAEGWWVGIDVVAPDDFSAAATYKVKTNPAAEYGAAKSFADMKDGEKDIQLWFPVSAESLEKFASEERNLTLVYAFDWNADDEYEQEIVFSVAPSEKIVLMKGEDQVYPVLKSTVNVSQNEGGAVSLNGDTTGTLVVENGTTVNVVVEADAGYQISKITINGNEIVVDAKNYTAAIENIAADATVSVTFVKLYTVTVTGNDKGSVSTIPEGQGGSVTVVDGSKVTVTATPEIGYRVTGVKINGVDQTVSGTNNSGYTVELTADTEYFVEVTFTSNIYEVGKEAADHGDFEIKNPSVEHGGSTVVVVTPGAGYTVDTFKVDGATVSDITKDETGIWFTVSDIKSDVKVVVTFKETAKSNIDDVSKDTEHVALRKTEDLFVVKDGDAITFKTERIGMRMYGDLGLIAGDAATQTITIPGDTTITSIELYYKADGELYADWHVVEMGTIRIVVDAEETESTFIPNDANEEGYYNSDVTFAVKVEDKNNYSGIDLVEYWITLNNVPGQAVKLYEYQDGAEVKAIHEDSIVVDASIYNSEYVKVTLRVLDRAGNEEIVEKSIKINSTKPTVSLAINGTQNNNAQDGYYKDKRTLAITIIDREDTFSKANVVAGLKIYKNETLIEVATTDITWDHTEGSNQYEGTYVFEDDAHYVWSFAYTNIAGLSNDGASVDANSKDVYNFCVDTVEPSELAITYTPDIVEVPLDDDIFGFYGEESIGVKVEAVDKTAGIEQFEYTYGEVTRTVSSDAINRDGDKFYATFSIPAQFRGSVSFKAMDKAGHMAKLEDDRIVVVDQIAPGVMVEWDPEKGVNNSKYFNTDRVAIIEITEDNFFAQDVEDGLLKITAHIVYNDGSSKVETYKPTFTYEDGKYVATITFSEEADYTFNVEYTDRSGNVYDKYPGETFVIDKTSPEITVQFDNNSAVNESYFKAERTATITVVEHNFNEAAMDVLVDGKKAEVKWHKADDAVDTYYAEYVFANDAHYAFEVNGMDLANNANIGVSLAEGTVAPWAFTVDKISPKISIEKANGAYFSANRTAKITVVEHNFRASDFEFTAKAYDVTGFETVLLLFPDDRNYLENQSSWKLVAPDTWEAEISFEYEGNYVIGATYSDLAGNAQVEAISDTFCVDKTDPNNLKVSYNPTFVGVLLENLTFGFYKAPVKVTIEATDQYAGVDYFEYSYTVQEGASSINVGKINQKVNATRDGETNRWYASFTIDPQFRGHVFFTAYDKATNNAIYPADEDVVVVVDSIPPVLNVKWDPDEGVNGNNFRTERTATIEITEANFFAQDIADGLLVITKTAVYNDGTEKTETLSPAFSKNGDVYTATELFDENADYTFTITYTDRAGNVANPVSYLFTVDKIAPIISVEYDNNSAKNDNQFKEDRTATITVVEHNFIADDVIATITANGTADMSYTNDLKDDANWKHYTLGGVEVDAPEKGDVHIAEIRYFEEAHYTFDIECSDLAGNTNVKPVDYGTSVAPKAFTLDKSAPTELTITINGASVLGTNSIAFDKFYGGSVTVKLGATCDISGLESLKYQKVTAVTDYDVNGPWLAYDAENGIVVNPSEKFIIYFRAEDRAGNVSIVNSTGIVVDDKKPTGETKAPEIDILPVAPNVHGYYNGDVIVNLKVVDPKHTGANASVDGYYSGLNKITYKIYTTDTDAVEEGVLLDLTNKTEGAEFDADHLVKAWTGMINVAASKFNSNNVIVVITAVDNAGNERTSTTVAGDIKIDITPSKIEVTYDNNDGDTSFTESAYFKADRTATIVVTERNFSPELFKVEIANTDGFIPEIGEWKTVTAGGNGDETTHTAQIFFNKDGDYTLAVSCVDKALNPNIEPDSKESLAPWAFTMDKTAPVVNITYDNNDVLNGNYYKAQRIATITVTEHNFENGRIKIALKATDNGKDATLPTVSNWTSNGDVHTAAITYAADSLYVFDFDYNDKAGNATADIAEQTFYVDKTNPVLKIEKIVDESANNDEGNIGFVMTATDTNFDVFSPVLTAVVKKGDAFETQQLEIGQITSIKNGKVFTVTNIEADGIYRITCTIVDKAGNAYSEVTLEKADGTQYVEKRAGEDTLVTFSVNRDGSTFEVDENTVGVVEQYYVQNVENDVVIVEINADPLKEYTVTLNSKALEKDKDYTVSEEGGNGAWMKYTYKVNKNLFADEGEYKLVVSSKDKADNDAFSDVKEAAVEFVVDRTAPVVTVSGIANDGRYQTDKQIVTLIPTDDGGALKAFIVNMVDEDGKVIKEVINLTGEALMTELEANGGKITFEMAEGLYQNVQIICTDCATGETEETNTHDTTIKNVSVSTSVFMIFWANKPLRWGTIGGVSAAAIALAVFIILKKKKRDTK